MITALTVLAGGLGACARWLLDSGLTALLRSRTGSAPLLPWGILVVNVCGSALTGLALGLPASAAAVVTVGFCGGFTTFSTVCADLLRLLLDRRPLLAAGLCAGMVALCGAAVVCGARLAGV